MSNRFRQQSAARVEEEDMEPRLKVKRDPENENQLFKKLFSEGIITKEAATKALPFLIFLSVLGMLYIANSHMAIRNIRNIDQLGREVKELSWEYKSLKADLMFKSKLTEVAKKVDTLGIKELTEPPNKIIISTDEH
ncbi:FtsL-like putative cell division protein [Pedobacter sp. JY14-1]|uniref:FtsL-like putative cell division protein n=1 Tax=Pedobacter sp. JY14-1 TaxID=3034151 RepID=UPI0023E1B5CB|nr:FtsL-like putative cell division protein [Pedobacter sp. JY14-1]